MGRLLGDEVAPMSAGVIDLAEERRKRGER